MKLTLSSDAFAPGAAIPAQYTCDGADASPPLRWDGVPVGTRSFALIVDDPDAPDPQAPRTIWVHWVVFNLPADLRELAAGASPIRSPASGIEGSNDWQRNAYGGPCPPIGRHRYFHKLYALDALLTETRALSKAQLERAMHGHVLDQAELVGTYERTR